MCTSPKTIYSRKLFFGTYDKLTLQVPCGHCWQCMHRKQDDYFVKAYYLAKHYYANGGFVFFDTLTYNETCIPIYRINGDAYYTFCLEHLREFRLYLFDELEKKLIDTYKFSDALMNNAERVKYMRSLGVETDIKLSKRDKARVLNYNEKRQIVRVFLKNDFDYLITSEYGHTTQRPHYHILFYCKNALITYLDVANLIRKCWDFGFTDSKYTVHDRVVNPQKLDLAISYVTKYVLKDAIYSQITNDLPNDCKQRVCVSHGFDIAVMNELNQDTILNGFRIYRKKQGKWRNYSVPLSCVDKYLYNKIKIDIGDNKPHKISVCKDWTARGIKLQRLLNGYENYCKKLRDIIYNPENYNFDLKKFEKLSLHIDYEKYCKDSYFRVGRFCDCNGIGFTHFRQLVDDSYFSYFNPKHPDIKKCRQNWTAGEFSTFAANAMYHNVVKFDSSFYDMVDEMFKSALQYERDKISKYLSKQEYDKEQQVCINQIYNS